jgi:hypothetical protein
MALPPTPHPNETAAIAALRDGLRSPCQPWRLRAAKHDPLPLADGGPTEAQWTDTASRSGTATQPARCRTTDIGGTCGKQTQKWSAADVFDFLGRSCPFDASRDCYYPDVTAGPPHAPNALFASPRRTVVDRTQYLLNPSGTSCCRRTVTGSPMTLARRNWRRLYRRTMVSLGAEAARPSRPRRTSQYPGQATPLRQHHAPSRLDSRAVTSMNRQIAFAA